LSEEKRTRAEKIHDLLLAAGGQWVYGSELLSWEVGGSRYSARIEELRKAGHHIESRPDPRPSHALWQYRLLTGEQPAPLREVWQCQGCNSVQEGQVGMATLAEDLRIGGCYTCKKQQSVWRKM